MSDEKLLFVEVALEFPVTVDGRDVSRIRFRRMKGRDKLTLDAKDKARDGGYSPFEYSMELFSLLAVEPLLTPAQFGEFDMIDLDKVDTALAPFVRSRPKTSAVPA